MNSMQQAETFRGTPTPYRSGAEAETLGGFYYGEDSAEGSINFWQVLTVLRKWWWLIALISITATAYTTLQVSRITPMYKSEASLEVKQRERNITGTDAVDYIDADREFLNTQIQLLQSERLAKIVVDSLGVSYFLEPADPEAAPLSREQKSLAAINQMRAGLEVTQVEWSRIFLLSYVHSDPKKAAEIVNTIAEKYIQSDLQRKYDATSDAREFLEARLETVKGSLATAERDLVEYASKNEIVFLEDEAGSGASGTLDKSALVILNNELTQAKSDLQKAQQSYESAQEGGFALEILSNPALKSLQEQRILLNSEYIEGLAVFKPAYPDMIELKSRIDLIDDTIADQHSSIITANLSSLKSEFEAAKSVTADLEQRVNKLKTDVVNTRERSIGYTIIKRQVDTDRAQYEGLLQRLKDISVADNIGTSLVEIIDLAKPAARPFAPNKRRSILSALLISSIFGFGLAFIIELIDDRIKHPDDIKAKLSLVTLGVIPHEKQSETLSDILKNPQSMIAEAYATLRANLQFSAMDGGPRLIQITSTQPGEGKSVSSLGLAMRYAGLGEKTLLIDADMRRPTFLSEMENDIGLSGLLTTKTPIDDYIQETKTENLDLITSGNSVPNPSEILTSTRFDEILDYARENYAYVIIDSPPIIGLADAPVLSSKSDASVMVIEANHLRKKSILSAIERLSLTGRRPLGVILTKYKSNGGSYGYYDYYGEGKSNKHESAGKVFAKVSPKQKFSL